MNVDSIGRFVIVGGEDTFLYLNRDKITALKIERVGDSNTGKVVAIMDGEEIVIASSIKYGDALKVVQSILNYSAFD